MAMTLLPKVSLPRLIPCGTTASQNLRVDNGRQLAIEADKRKLPSSLGQPQGEALVRATIRSLVRASIRAGVRTSVRALVRDSTSAILRIEYSVVYKLPSLWYFILAAKELAEDKYL